MTEVVQRPWSRAASLAGYALTPSIVIARVYSEIVRRRLGSCGPGLQMRLSTQITGHANISIGRRFISMGLLNLAAHDGELRIGDDCHVNCNVQFGAASGRLLVGNDVIIGPNVVIRVADHGMSRGQPMRTQPHVRGEVIIEDDVWIGANAVITADVRLARGTIVAAGAVVTRSTEPYSIVGGVPAKKIGERV